jgi:hypothetical protein
MENHMAKTLQKGFIVIGAVAALVIGAAGVANADWDDGWHRGWHHRWHGHYAYYPGHCFVRRSAYINKWGVRVVRSERICD